MKNDIELYLSFPPTVNSYYMQAKRGRYISRKGRLYGEKVAKEINEQMIIETLDVPLFVEVVVFPPDRRRRDLDNYMKALLDSCTSAALWTDDSIIDQLHVFRGEIIKDGGIKMSITDAGPVIPFLSV